MRRPNYHVSSSAVASCIVLDDEHQNAHLPLVKVTHHTHVQSSAYTATLTQTYSNPLESTTIKRLQYTFPLFDGISIVDFECHIGDRIIKGLVKERHEARATFEAAAQKGETAGLLDQLSDASDVFTTLLSNILPKSTLKVIVRYVGELKHDMGSDSLRLTIPMAVATRYGSVSGPLLTEQPLQPAASRSSTPTIPGGGVDITVDVEMAESCPIQKMSSPSNPIEVSLGMLSTDADAAHSPNKASASLALQQSVLEQDFVLEISAKDVGAPQALLETHATMQDQKAVMATFVPKFALKPEKPEIIFIVDRSGSMGGVVELLKSAMRVCIKSLSPGVRFNILSFGSDVHLLWDKSKIYDADSLQQASDYVEDFLANFGGTETLRAVKHAIESRRPDICTELMLLTDGEIWQQNDLFEYLNDQVRKTKGNVRLFSLGIGGQVSHAFIEGCARAGSGFAQSVAVGERFDGKIVRMIKGAVMPHLSDCKFRIQFDENDDEFEFVEKAPTVPPKERSAINPSVPISLYDPEAEKEASSQMPDKSELIPLEPPATIYAPCNIQSLSSFSRTTVYVLLSASATLRTPKAVLFSASTSQGQLELSIPISTAHSGKMVHQLAARKAILELEENRGWVVDVQDENGSLLKETQPTRLEDLVRLEGARLGTKFQVASKWCSFVAVEANSADEVNRKRDEAISHTKVADSNDDGFEMVQGRGKPKSPPRGQVASASAQAPFPAALPPPPPATSLFAPGSAPAPAPQSRSQYAPSFGGTGLMVAGQGMMNQSLQKSVANPTSRQRRNAGKPTPVRWARRITASYSTDEGMTGTEKEVPLLERIISSQSFDGCWPCEKVPWKDLHVDAPKVQSYGHAKDLLATALVVLYLEKKMNQDSEAWELVVEKARSWIEDNQSDETAKELDGSNENLWTKARQLLNL